MRYNRVATQPIYAWCNVCNARTQMSTKTFLTAITLANNSIATSKLINALAHIELFKFTYTHKNE